MYEQPCVTCAATLVSDLSAFAMGDGHKGYYLGVKAIRSSLDKDENGKHSDIQSFWELEKAVNTAYLTVTHTVCRPSGEWWLPH